MSLHQVKILIVTAVWGCSLASNALAYEKAVEGPDVVLNKLFPKKNKVELDGRFGMMLNTSYQQTFFAGAGLNYFWSEAWGFSAEGYFALASDKAERKCIESFYNDPNYNVDLECSEEPPVENNPSAAGQDANWGPAYVPIRQLKYMFVGNFVWNPMYGKQIVLLSATNYFDFYLSAGGGIAMSEAQPKTATFWKEGYPETGRRTRDVWRCPQADRAEGKCDEDNPGTDNPDLIGKFGRPPVQSATNPVIKLAVGQRFHFFKRFSVNGALENFTTIGGESGFDNFFTIMGGLGVRF